MKIARFKMLKIISITIMGMFSIYTQREVVLIGIKHGISTKSIMITLVELNVIPCILIFLFLISVKIIYENRQPIKCSIINAFRDRRFISIGFVGTLLISFRDDYIYGAYILFLVIIFIVYVILKIKHVTN